MTAAEGTYQGSVAGMSQLQTFLDTYVCEFRFRDCCPLASSPALITGLSLGEANRNGSRYFWFSPFDEEWKRQFGGVSRRDPGYPVYIHTNHLCPRWNRIGGWQIKTSA